MRFLLLIAALVMMPLLSFAQTTTSSAPLAPHNPVDAPPSPDKALPTPVPPKSGDWVRDMDLGKLVGAATAPVNLIIAATIAISFLIAKQGALFAKFLLILEQYKKQPEDRVRSDKLYHQLGVYAMRLRLINWAGRALAITIVIFIVTVTLTSFGVIFPDVPWVKIGTGLTLLAGLASMLLGMVFQIADGRLEAKSIDLEMKEMNAARSDPK